MFVGTALAHSSYNAKPSQRSLHGLYNVTMTSQVSSTAKAFGNNAYRWFIPQLGAHLRPRTRRVFEEYVSLKPEEVEDHITAIVGRAPDSLSKP